MLFKKIVNFFVGVLFPKSAMIIDNSPTLLDDDLDREFDELFGDIVPIGIELLKAKTISVDRSIAYKAVVLESTECGASYDDSEYPNPDFNPDRLLVRIKTIDCDFESFYKALYLTEEGNNFCHTNNMIIDIGGSRLKLESGSKIIIYSDNTVSN